MPRVQITRGFAGAAACPSGRPTIDFFDIEQRGFMLEVRASGGKTFYQRYTDHRGRERQFKIGPADVLSLDQARRKARLVLARNMDEMMALVRAGQDIGVDRRVRFRYDSAMAVAKSVEAIDLLFTASGGRAIFLGNPILRYFLDVHAARAHYANNPEKPGRNFGGVQLGMKTAFDRFPVRLPREWTKNRRPDGPSQHPVERSRSRREEDGDAEHDVERADERHQRVCGVWTYPHDGEIWNP